MNFKINIFKMIQIILAVYSALVRSVGLFLRIQRPRVKFYCRFFGNCITNNSEWFTSICQFTIVNASSKPIAIDFIYYRFKETKGHLNFSEVPDQYPKIIGSGEFIFYPIDYSLHNDLIKKVNATKIKLIAIDITGKQYKSKWVTMKIFPKLYGHINESPVNNEAILLNLEEYDKNYEAAKIILEEQLKAS